MGWLPMWNSSSNIMRRDKCLLLTNCHKRTELMWSLLSMNDDCWEGPDEIKEESWWNLPNPYCPLVAWAAEGSPPTVTEGQVTGDGSMVLLQFDFISLQVSGPRCENLSPVYFGSVSPGDGHRSASNPATAQCHQLLTGTWTAGTFKRCLLTWNTLSDLVPPPKFPCGRPMTKERESPYVSGSEMTNIHSVIS